MGKHRLDRQNARQWGGPALAAQTGPSGPGGYAELSAEVTTPLPPLGSTAGSPPGPAADPDDRTPS
jgi:hypothetical protein